MQLVCGFVSVFFCNTGVKACSVCHWVPQRCAWRYVVTTGDCGRCHYCITWRRYHGARHVTFTASVWYTRPQTILCGQWRNLLEPHSRRQVNRCPAKRQSRAAQHHKETQTVGTPHAGGFLRLSTVLHIRRIHFWLYLISLKILHEPSSWSLTGRPSCVQRRETNICRTSYRKRLMEWRVNEYVIHIEERNVRHRLFPKQSTVLLYNPTVAQPEMEYPALYGIRRSITVLTGVMLGPCPEPVESNPQP
jgi:hypothetical protein